jgi:hypothetical protein
LIHNSQITSQGAPSLGYLPDITVTAPTAITLPASTPEDGYGFNYSVTASIDEPQLASVSVDTNTPDTSILEITPTAGQRGVAHITVTLTDGNATVNQTFTAMIIGPTSPTLAMQHAGTNLILTWPLSVTNYVVEETSGSPGPGAVWTYLLAPMGVTNNQHRVIVPIARKTQYFRLYNIGSVTPGSLPLRLQPAGTNLVLSWPVSGAKFVVQATGGSLTPPIIWTNVPVYPILTNNTYNLSLPASASKNFYRLYFP